MNKFKKDSAFNFASILHLQRYMNNHNGYIAGGCFKNVFKNEKVKDVDVFFENKEDFEDALIEFRNNDEYNEIYENENAVGFFDNKMKVQIDLVRSSFLPPQEMIQSFDFTIAKFALYNKKIKLEEIGKFELDEMDDDVKKGELKVVYHESFFEHLMLNRLVIDEDEIEFPLNTLDRMFRYAKYGYAPCTGTKVKIVRSINILNLPDDDTNLFKGFYVGID